jgi:hypothetical protein
MAARQIKLGATGYKFGTLQWGTTFGTVKSASVNDTCDEAATADGKGDTEMVLWHNERYEVSMEVVFKSTAAPPARGDQLTIPDFTTIDDGDPAPAKANVKDLDFKWDNGQMKSYTIKATHWTNMGNVVATVVTEDF